MNEQGSRKTGSLSSRYKALNFTQAPTTTMRKRGYRLKVEMLAETPDPAKSLQDFYQSLPRVGASLELIQAAEALAQTALAGRDIVWLIDAPFLDAGLSPLIVRLINKGLIKTIAMTCSAAIRDYELASYGVTNEDVRQGIKDGLLGMARETGEGINQIINEGVKRGFSLGECLGRGVLDRQPKYYNRSILAACAAKLVTLTIHVSLGADGFQCHPTADGSMLGKGSMKDLQILAARIEGLNEGGTVVATHRCEALQGALIHAFAASRNSGSGANQFNVIRFGDSPADFSEVPGVNSVFSLGGPLELMIPLFTGVLFSLVE